VLGAPVGSTLACKMTRALSLIVAAMLAAAAMAQTKPPSLYTISSAGWQQNSTPYGEVFTCSVCDGQIQVQIAVGPPLTAKAPFRTNEQFLSSLRTPEQQRSFAEGLLKSDIPLQYGYSLKIERTSITKLGGLDAFQFMAIVDLKPVPTRDTTVLLVHRQRLVKVSLNYHDGSFDEKARSAVNALFASIKFQ
jgi:hypothetical protein